MFGVEGAGILLFFKIDKEYWPALKTFMIFLNMIPEQEMTHKKGPATVDDFALLDELSGLTIKEIKENKPQLGKLIGKIEPLL